MPQDIVVPAGAYKLRKQFRHEETVRRKKDIPWSKKILNLEKHQLFGRTAWAWFRIVAFYMVLYIIIACILLFWILILIYAIINGDEPKWKKEFPGLSIIPRKLSTFNYYSDILDEVYPIADQIDDFLNKLKGYKDDIDFVKCNEDKLWGYHAKTPCFFVKLNYIIGFEARTYDNVSDIPNSAPDELKEHFKKHEGDTEGKIWLTCNNKDWEKPTFTYYPTPYYDTDTGLRGVDRIIAVQLKDMPIDDYMGIVCKVWAKNIPIDTQVSGHGQAVFKINMK
ncbi:CG11703, partial [Drosophila busckii]